MRSRPLIALLLLLAASRTLPAQDPPYVVLDDGRRVSGVSVRADEDGQILLNTGRGVLTFEAGTRVVTARPRELDRAIQHMQQRQFTEAAAQLRVVIEEYRYLGWDLEALKLLPRAYIGAGRPGQAADTYTRLFERAPETRRDGDELMRYFQSLETDGRTDALIAQLDDAIRQAPRNVAAWAQLRRGQAAFEAGEYEAALLDFKRTADFFRDQSELLPEALYRTAVTLRRLNNDAAQRYYQELRQDHADSPFASRPLD